MRIDLIGGTGGIGQQLAYYLSNGFEVCSVGRKYCDVTNPISTEEWFLTSKPDVVVYLSVNNIDGQLHKQTSETVDSQIAVNIDGLLNVIRYVTPTLRERSGKFIYISSILADKPAFGTGVYSASKCFGESLMRSWAIENAKFGCTGNSIQLGYFHGGLTESVPKNIP